MDKEISPPTRFRKSGLLIALLVFFLVCAAALTGYLYSSTPDIIRHPSQEHYHFRMQILVDGKPENFAAAKYQEGYSKDSCTVALTDHPVHFHDSKDQIVHIHWEGMTGGLVLKYYGWNYVGGLPNSLGYRFDKLPRLINVPIYGKILPAVPAQDHFYVYSGDKNSYKARDSKDFFNQDLERFFGKTSTFPAHHFRSTALNWLLPTAYAHNTSQAHLEDEAADPDFTDAQLTQLNNLIGNVVIFVQKNKPTDSQVKDRFNHLEPLSASVCGG